MLYQYDEDCAGDGVIVVRIYASERLRGFPGAFSMFWVGVKRDGGGGWDIALRA